MVEGERSQRMILMPEKTVGTSVCWKIKLLCLNGPFFLTLKGRITKNIPDQALQGFPRSCNVNGPSKH